MTPPQPVNAGYAQQGRDPAALAVPVPIPSPSNILWAPPLLPAAPAHGLTPGLYAVGPSTSSGSLPMSAMPVDGTAGDTWQGMSTETDIPTQDQGVQF